MATQRLKMATDEARSSVQLFEVQHDEGQGV